MHRPLLLSAVSIFLAAAIALVTASIFMQPPPLIVSAAGEAGAVRRFYAAVNDVIARGDVTALHAVVALHFVDQDPLPGIRADREGLEDYLLALHATAPETELVAESIVTDGDRAVARVAVRRGQGATRLDRVIVGQPDPWGPVDVFRISGSMVVERWSDTKDLALVRPLAEVSLEFPVPSPRVVTIERMTIAAGVHWNPLPSGPRLLLLEGGALRVEVAALASASATAPLAGSAEQAAGGRDVADSFQAVTLAPGESSVIPAGVRLDTANVGSTEAEVLVVTFSEPRTPGGATIADSLPAGIARQTLAGGLATDIPFGPATLALGQVTLARNARLSLSSTEGPVLIAVDAGRLKMATWGEAWRRRGSDGMSVDANESEMGRGDGLLMHTGGLTDLQNAGDGPVVALVATLQARE